MPPLFGVLLLLLLATFFYKVYRHIARPDDWRMSDEWLAQFRRGYNEAERWRQDNDV